jgi:DNA-binding CsgD family transcriptional regulator
MTRLRERELHAALEFVHAASSVDEAEPFPPPVLALLARVVPAEIVGYSEWELGPVPRLLSENVAPWVSTPGEVSRARAAFCSTYPLSIQLCVDEPGPVAISDFLTRRELHRLDYWDQVLRPFGIEHQLRLWLPAPAGRSRLFQFSRLGVQGDFDDCQRSVLEFLRPFLAAVRDRFELRLTVRPNGSGALTKREAEILSWIARGKSNEEIALLLFLSPHTIRKHLENAYRKLGVHTRAAAVAWLVASRN